MINRIDNFLSIKSRRGHEKTQKSVLECVIINAEKTQKTKITYQKAEISNPQLSKKDS